MTLGRREALNNVLIGPSGILPFPKASPRPLLQLFSALPALTWFLLLCCGTLELPALSIITIKATQVSQDILLTLLAPIMWKGMLLLCDLGRYFLRCPSVQLGTPSILVTMTLAPLFSTPSWSFLTPPRSCSLTVSPHQHGLYDTGIFPWAELLFVVLVPHSYFAYIFLDVFVEILVPHSFLLSLGAAC